jgi:hypothetical protein
MVWTLFLPHEDMHASRPSARQVVRQISLSPASFHVFFCRIEVRAIVATKCQESLNRKNEVCRP